MSLFLNIVLPQGTSVSQYPDDFLRWVEDNKANGSPSKPFIKKFENVVSKEPETERRSSMVSLWFGHQIWDTYRAAKSFIISRLNTLWIPLKSGENLYALYCSIRKTLYDNHADELAKQSVTQRYKTKKRGTEGEAKPSQNDIQLEIQATAKAKFDALMESQDWYPDYWLSFIALGAPAGSSALVSLTTGIKDPSDEYSGLKVENTAVIAKKSRSGRRNFDSLNAGFSAANAIMSPSEVNGISKAWSTSSSVPSSVEKSAEKNEVHHIISRGNEEAHRLQIVLRMYEDLSKEEPESIEFKAKIREMRLRIIALLDK
jgi:hypothetical protein